MATRISLLLGLACAPIAINQALGQYPFPTETPVSHVTYAESSQFRASQVMTGIPAADPQLIESPAIHSSPGPRPVLIHHMPAPSSFMTRKGSAIPTIISSDPSKTKLGRQPFSPPVETDLAAQFWLHQETVPVAAVDYSTVNPSGSVPGNAGNAAPGSVPGTGSVPGMTVPSGSVPGMVATGSVPGDTAVPGDTVPGDTTGYVPEKNVPEKNAGIDLPADAYDLPPPMAYQDGINEIQTSPITPTVPTIDSVPAAGSPAFPAPVSAVPLSVVDARSNTRPRIVFQPAVAMRGPAGQSILRPTVHVADSPQIDVFPTLNDFSDIALATPMGEERTPLPEVFQADKVWVPSEFGQRARAFRQQRRKPFVQLYRNVQSILESQAGRDVGVGAERLPFALFEMDASQPSNNFRLRFDFAYDWEFPDRAEYFWSQLGKKGPDQTVPGTPLSPVESSVDYQDIRMSFEVGGPKFSMTTEIPLRFINPTVLGNTGGMGDMVMTTKTVMVDGDSLQITQVLRNQLPTGTAKRGRGVGHVSMEPGIIARYKWSERTMLHNELKLWFPLGGTPGFSGPVLRYGFGYANLLYDSDSFAVIPTFEFVGWSILTGQKTPQFGPAQRVDGENILNFYPGVRLVRDSDGDLGMFEFGISGGASLTTRHWYSSLLRMELRWTF